AVLAWLGASDETRNEYAAPSEAEASGAYSARDARSTLGAFLGEDGAAPDAAEFAVLYFAPESAGVTDALGALFGDA
ncbi:MAG TPA: hypothetical protein VGE74_22435, partial [Gemmata sp.]